MDHLIERFAENGFRGQDEVLFRSLGKNDVLLLSAALIAFAPMCYFKGMPHDSAALVSVGSFFLGIMLLVWGGTKCELTFRRKLRAVEVRWFILGISASVHEYKFEQLRFFIRWKAGISGWRNVTISTPRPWLAMTTARAVFLFQRPPGVIVSEIDIPLLLCEL